MRKLFFILLLCSILSTSVSGQFFAPNQKPGLGFKVNGGHPLAPDAGLWPFNEGSGTLVNDLSGNKNNGKLIGTAAWTSSPMGAAVNCDDSSANSIILASGGSYPFANGFTWVVWGIVNTWPVNAWQSKNWTFGYIDTNNRIELRIGNDGDPSPRIGAQVEANNVDDSIWFSLPTAIVDVPIMMAVTYDISNVRLYLDGIQVNSAAKTDSFTANMGLRNVGYACDMKTIMASEYNRPLSASEIAQLYREPFCFMQPSFSWVLYSGISVTPSGQIIFIN